MFIGYLTFCSDSFWRQCQSYSKHQIISLIYSVIIMVDWSLKFLENLACDKFHKKVAQKLDFPVDSMTNCVYKNWPISIPNVSKEAFWIRLQFSCRVHKRNYFSPNSGLFKNSILLRTLDSFLWTVLYRVVQKSWDSVFSWLFSCCWYELKFFWHKNIPRPLVYWSVY